MFPLEQAILPTAVVPLHIFEPRYRQFARDITPLAEPEFGIAPIERGREVGGDDVRADIGIVARVLQSEELPDGRWGIVSAATRRIRVVDWLADDPYPRARVEDWPDNDADTYRGGIDDTDRAALVAALARVRAALTRLDPNRPGPPIKLVDDPAQATWQSAVHARLGPLDSLTLLREPSAVRRIRRAAELIGDRAEVLEALADQGR